MYAAAILVTDSLLDPEDRLYGCLVIQICQTIIIACYFWTFFFSLLFRMALIRFSERGLVERGKPNLLLFHQLYWTVFGAFTFMIISISTIMPLLQGTFSKIPHNQMCMLRPVEDMESESNITKNILIFVLPLICTIYQQLITYKVRKHVSGLCPNDRMGTVGKYRRNLIDFEDNSRYITYWMVYSSILTTGIQLAISAPGISPVTIFRIAHGNSLAFVWFFHGLVLPLSMEIPWKSRGPRKASPFYVRKPALLPRMYHPAPQPGPSHPTQSMNPSQTLTANSGFPPCSAEDWFRPPSPIPSPIPTLSTLLSQHSSQQQQESKPREKEQTIFYSSNRQGYQVYKPDKNKKKPKVNAILMTALKKRKDGVRSPESDTYPAAFKCDVCNYECKRNATLQKHNNTKHGHKGRNKIAPCFVLESPPSLHSPTALLSSLPTFSPTSPVMKNTITQQTTDMTRANQETSRETGRHHEVRLTNLGGQTNRADLPSID